MSQRIVVVNSDGAEQAFGTAGSNGQAPNAATEVVLVNSDGTEQTVVSAGSTSPIPASYAQVVVVNSAGVEQTIGTVGSTSPIPAKFVQGVMVDESGSEVTVTSSGGVTPIPAKFRRLLTVNSDGTYQPFTVGTPVSLTLSGNEITDAVRAAGLSGDGLSPEGSTGIWEASTNYTLNGGCESGISNVGGNGSASIERTTALAKFGVACLKVTTGGVAGAEGANFSGASGAAAEGQTWTVSAWVRHAEAGPVDLAIRASWRTAADALISEPQGAPVSVAPGVWTKLSLTSVAPATTDRVRVKPVTSGTQAIVFYVDGVQSEPQPLATPYVETGGGTASRSASRVRVPVANVLDETQAWVATRMRMGWVNTADPSGNPVVFDWRDDANNLLQARFDTTGNTWELQRRNGGGTGEVTKADTFALSDVVTVIAAWDASNLKISVDGSAFTSAAAANIPTLSATTVDVGSIAGTSEHIDADLFWVSCGTGTLTDADAANIHANGNSDPYPGLFPSTADLTMIWKAIDGTARTY